KCAKTHPTSYVALSPTSTTTTIRSPSSRASITVWPLTRLQAGMSLRAPGSVAMTRIRVPGGLPSAAPWQRMTGMGQSRLRASTSMSTSIPALMASQQPCRLDVVGQHRRHAHVAARAVRGDEVELDLVGVAALPVAGGDARGELHVLGAGRALDQRQRPLMRAQDEMVEAATVALQVAALAFVARDDDLEMGARADVAADLEQHDVVELVVLAAAVLPQVGQLARVVGVGEETAAAGGLGPLGEAELLCQRGLRLAAPAGEVGQRLAVHPALALGQRRRAVARAKGPKEPVAGAGFARDDGESEG